MDTISINLYVNKDKRLTSTELKDLAEDIAKFKSTEGYRYITLNSVSKGDRVSFKLTYPRFYDGNNAFIIRSKKMCIKLQEHFIKCLCDFGYDKYFTKVEVIRVDIPFTFYMEENKTFNSYFNLFVLFADIYEYESTRRSSITVERTRTREKETVYYADTPVVSNYNSRIVIYNQNLNIKLKYTSDDNDEQLTYENVLWRHPDLPKRIRIEVSKRVKRHPIPLYDFAKLDILETYYENFKTYLLDNIFDLNILDKVTEDRIETLTIKFNKRRDNKGFNFGKFILQEQVDIRDYKSLRLAMKKSLKNPISYKGNLFQLRNAITEYEMDTNNIIFDVRDKFLEMRELTINDNITS